MTASPSAAALDGALFCRIDPATGRTVAVVPARCREGLHWLDPEQSPVTITGGHLTVACPRCDPASGRGAAWLLAIPGPCPALAELDDAPYLGRYRWALTGE
ncbi:hypothetical protein [Actinokineospora iranica]|uniref:Uncharacterized protein n=1 Tax=Actinokineospora iranica TaxID=1271860 RepID=A0A1G6WSF3_9PSEU|nr:hypothetical protein [Actinokineospora iranica]SDD68729.1 hypothetical protein SAMN05216174_115148 [Actinokineospora iranica]